MKANLPVFGNGKTHYYHQGPVFEDSWRKVYPNKSYNRWDPKESINVENRDMGAVKGTSLKDLVNLVGGMSKGDEVRVKGTDGFYKWFAFENICRPPSRQGPIVLCWYNSGKNSKGEGQGTGYPPDYYSGMRLVFFAPVAGNSKGLHCFGNWDMYGCLAKKYWHFYGSGKEKYPSSSGLSVKRVAEIAIYTKNISVSKTKEVDFCAQKISGKK
jgi:hypothetical protein